MSVMQLENRTGVVMEFIIVGFSDLPKLQSLLVFMFVLIYHMTLIGNLAILAAIYAYACLHTPMYVFLMKLSLLEISSTSVTFPKFLVMYLTEDKRISFTACMTQLYFFMSFTSTEFYLPAAMEYDRCVAICHPSRYPTIMNKQACILLATASLTPGFLDTVPTIVLSSQFYFCHSVTINHFFCDLRALMKLSCCDTHSFDLMRFITGVLAGLVPFLLTLISYVHIMSTILKIQSVAGRHKTFSICASRLTVVILFYSTVICIHKQPPAKNALDQEKLFAVLYTAFIPMLNPLIYSLRNKDLKGDLTRISDRKLLIKDDSLFGQKSRQLTVNIRRIALKDSLFFI